VAAAARSRVVSTALRLALLAVGVAQAGLAWPELAFGQAAMSAPMYMAHETGAWSLGVAAAFLSVAAAPRLAPGALPFLGTFTAFLVPVTLADLAAGHVHADRAAVHLLLLAGLVLVATVAWRGRRRRTAAVASQPAAQRVSA
jgi:predicted anti-sigma-YlaC factor YlaD